ncbi:DsrE family protein [Haladaptatus caseinilyticus]|uniref:DsrE family protein n=1 Tax=Haladaptatus caseinilyticus TaxID=2993314 RepID=UPI00224B6E89|nr:DsrE family protein [Haladaptatus caseinilyticus]
MGNHSRRRFLELAGAGTAVALAGCSGGPGEAATTDTTGTNTGTKTENRETTDETTEQADQSKDTTMSTVFHFSSGESHQKHAVANVANLVNDGSTDVATVELVANGQGIRLVTKDSTVAEKVKSLVKQGVRFKACRNSMDAFNFSKTDLLKGVETVPAGVGELTKLQARKEYAYIKTP